MKANTYVGRQQYCAGGATFDSSVVTVMGSRFTENRYESSSGSWATGTAAGIVFWHNQWASTMSSAILTSTLIDRNQGHTAPMGGALVGGLEVLSASVVLSDCEVRENEGQLAGGIHVWMYKHGSAAPKLVVADSVIAGNRGEVVGGLMIADRGYGTVLVVGSELSDNLAYDEADYYYIPGRAANVWAGVVEGADSYRMNLTRPTNTRIVGSYVSAPEGATAPNMYVFTTTEIAFSRLVGMSSPLVVTPGLAGPTVTSTSLDTGPSSLSWKVESKLDTRASFSATSCYWGAAQVSEMDAKGANANISGIYDYRDDIEISKVDYSSWAHSAFPLAHIDSPSWGLSFQAGKPVTLSGSASDPEDGDLPSSALSWTSATDGPLGTGPSLSTSSLSVGLHRIWLTGTDSHGQEGKVYTDITIVAP